MENPEIKSEFINPIEYLKSQHGITPEHIVHDPNVTKEYDIIRGSKHDGTLIFTLENINRCLEPLVNSTSYCKTSAPADRSTIKGIRYTVGNIEVISDCKRVDLPCGKFPGVEEVVKIPVRCEYILKDSADYLHP